MIKVVGDASDVTYPASKHPLYWRWVNMLGRCYDPNHHCYESYGAKGIFVEEYLTHFGNYVNFVSSLENYNNLLCEPEKWDIDKDISGGKCYSRETIKIVPKKINIDYENLLKKKPIAQIDEIGNIVAKFESINQAEKATGIHRGNISRAARIRQNAGGYKWRYLSEVENASNRN